MKEKDSDITIHLLASLTAVAWGIFFASTKELIEHRLTPAQITLIRFLLAYMGIWFIFIYAANVTLIIAITPLTTAYITHLLIRTERFRHQLLSQPDRRISCFDSDFGQTDHFPLFARSHVDFNRGIYLRTEK